MMPKLSFTPDSSFFRKIAIGAVGARSVAKRTSHESAFGYLILFACGCGMRVECRAKTKADLSMSHSPMDEARALDFGMVDSDVVAFPAKPTMRAAFRCPRGQTGRHFRGGPGASADGQPPKP